MKIVIGIGAAILLLIGTALSAQAIPITVSFTASGFQVGAPVDPVTGSVTYDAASITSNINSLMSINLTIDGHTYSLGEAGFTSPFSGARQLIGGTVSGVGSLSSGTTDFVLLWGETSLLPVEFAYTDTFDTNVWGTVKFDQFSVVADPVPSVPEPGSLLLFGAGMIALRIARRRRG